MKKVIIITGLLAVTGLLTWFILRKKKNNTEDSLLTGASSADTFPLKKGSQGANVKRLQTHLNGLIENANNVMSGISTPDPLLVTDGIFGQLTEKEVLRYYSVKEVSQTLFNSKNM